MGVGSVCSGGASSAHCFNRWLTLLHLDAFAHGLHFVHDVSERLLHCLLQEPALALALWILRISKVTQGAVDILQAHSHTSLQGTGTQI